MEKFHKNFSKNRMHCIGAEKRNCHPFCTADHFQFFLKPEIQDLIWEYRDKVTPTHKGHQPRLID